MEIFIEEMGCDMWCVVRNSPFVLTHHVDDVVKNIVIFGPKAKRKNASLSL